MKFHRFANIFPLFEGDVFEEFKENIKQHGLLQPIILFEKKILDGRNRYRACKELNLPPKFEEYKGNSPLEFVISMNLVKRDLTPSQRAVIAQDALPLLEEEAKKRLATGGEGIYGGKPPRELIPKAVTGRSSEHAGKLFNINEKYVREVKKLKEEGKEKEIELIRKGDKTITQVKRQLKEEKREAERKADAKRAERIESPEELFKEIKFSTIVIDPPWDWADEGDVNQLGRAKPDYATSSFEKLKNLPINNLTKKDAHIYLWITNRSLPKGFKLLREWGFRYITCLTWCKPSIGMGNYFRGSTEHILFGLKGSLPLKRKDVGTWFEAKRGKGGHSSKPDEFYSLVESCSLGLYLDYFGRKKREGWYLYPPKIKSEVLYTTK